MVDYEESEDEGCDTPIGSVDGGSDHGAMATGIPTPDSMPILSPMLHHDDSTPDPRMGLPHRYNTHAMEAGRVFGVAEQNYYPRQNMDVFQQSPITAEPVRQRNFTAEDYQTPQQSLGWQQQSMVSAGPGVSSYYGHPSGPSHPLSSASIFQLGHTLPPPPSMMVLNPGQHFDGLPLPGRFLPNSSPMLGTQFRTGSLGHPHQMQPQGFEGYLHGNEGQFVQEMKEEPNQQQHHPNQHQHHHMHSQ